MSKVLLSFVLVAVLAQNAAADVTDPLVVTSPPFLDVADDSGFAADIRAISFHGITKGCDESGRFYCPDRVVTRGEMAAFLVRGLGLEVGSEPAGFVDDDGSVFEGSIGALAAAGITKGCNPPDNDLFCPERGVTRGEMAAFLVRGLGLEVGSEPAGFVDDDGSVFEGSIGALAAAGITKGCNPPENDLFCPERGVTRGEMAAFLVRGLGLGHVAAIPPGVRFARSATETVVGSRVEVCQPEVAVAVSHAAWGSVYPKVGLAMQPSGITMTGGSYDAVADAWVTDPVEGCFVFEARWDPKLNDLVAPLSSLQVTSHFGYRFHPVLGIVRLHAGIDFAASPGSSVMAAASGVVTGAGWASQYGRMVTINHPGGLTTRYAHLSSIAVSVGEVVESGHTIGGSGCTGLCTGPHLHFETLEFGVPVNPLGYLP